MGTWRYYVITFLYFFFRVQYCTFRTYVWLDIYLSNVVNVMWLHITILLHMAPECRRVTQVDGWLDMHPLIIPMIPCITILPNASRDGKYFHKLRIISIVPRIGDFASSTVPCLLSVSYSRYRYRQDVAVGDYLSMSKSLQCWHGNKKALNWSRRARITQHILCGVSTSRY
jgi:hypothetical protein